MRKKTVDFKYLQFGAMYFLQPRKGEKSIFGYETLTALYLIIEDNSIEGIVALAPDGYLIQIIGPEFYEDFLNFYELKKARKPRSKNVKAKKR